MLLGFGSAASANSGITPAHAFAHGTGSPQDPYQIATPAQLMYFDQQATSSTAAYELVQSVNLQGMNWAPVANFQGTFNGQGFTISNVSISSSVTGPNGNNDEGFFGYTQSATVENLVLSQITLQNTSTSSTLIQVGALAGHFSGGRLDEVSVTAGQWTEPGLFIQSTAGGLVGNNSGTITHCSANINSTHAGYMFGGLVGSNQGTLSHVTASGTEDSPSTNWAGGLVALNLGGTVIDSTAGTEVVAASMAAGLIAQNQGGIIQNAMASGAVDATNGLAAGLVATNAGRIVASGSTSTVFSTSGSAAGLVGVNAPPGILQNTFATGGVLGSSLNGAAAGGLIYLNEGTLSQSYAADPIDTPALIANWAKLFGNAQYGSLTTTMQTGFAQEFSAASPTVGGVIGQLLAGRASEVYWSPPIAQVSTPAGGTSTVTGVYGVPAAAMTHAATFSGWDFHATWAIVPGSTVPYLRGLQAWSPGTLGPVPAGVSFGVSLTAPVALPQDPALQVASSDLPPGLNLSRNGTTVTLNGTPQVPGTDSVPVVVYGASAVNPAPAVVASGTVALTVEPAKVEGLAPVPGSVGPHRWTATWNAVYGATGYTVNLNGQPTASPTTPEFTDTQVDPASTYQLTVAAVYHGLVGPDSVPATVFTPPLTPTGLAAPPDAATSPVTWNAATGATGYLVDINGHTVTPVPLTLPTYRITGATPGVPDSVTVAAVYHGAQSAFTSPVMVTLPGGSTPSGGSGNGGSSAPAPATPPLEVHQSLPRGVGATLVVTSAEGVGISIHVPAAAVVSPTVVTLTPLSALPNNVPGRGVLQAFKVAKSVGAYWAAPVTVRLTFRSLPSAVGVAFWNRLTQRWQSMAGVTVSQNTVTFETRHFTTFAVMLPTSFPHVARLAGSNRIRTAIAAAESAFPDGARAVVLANAGTGTPSPDALSAAGLAGALHAPILLTSAKTLSPAVQSAIRQLGAQTVYVIGGPAAIANTVVASLNAEHWTVVRQFAGRTRFQTARLVDRYLYDHHRTTATTLFVANGATMIDALSASPVLFRQGAPLVLVNNQQARLSARTIAWIRAARFHQVIVLGLQAAVSPQVVRQLDRAVGTSHLLRLGGASRSGTAVAIDRHFFGTNPHGAVIAANGSQNRSFVDALPAASMAGMNDVPIVLSRPTGLARSARQYLATLSRLSPLWVMGGQATLTPSVTAELRRL